MALNPTPGDRHVSRPLTDLSIMYRQKAENFAVANSTPRIMSEQETNQFFTYTADAWHRSEAELRAAGTPTKLGEFELSTDTFTVLEYAIGKAITDNELDNFDAPQDPEGEAVDYVTDQIVLLEEKKFSDVVIDGTWDISLTGGTEFVAWDQAGSTPIEDIDTRKTAILKATAREPNVLYCGREVWDVLKNHAELVDRLIPSGASDRRVTRAMLAELLELDEIVVSSAIENTARQGATASNSYVVGKHALLCYVNRTGPRIKEPSAFYTFVQNGLFGAERMGQRVRSFREERIRSTIVEAESKFVHKLVATSLGARFGSAVS